MKNALACENCGSTEKLVNHHTRYVPDEEFKTLCLKCHYKEHRKLGAPVSPGGFYPRPRRDWSKNQLGARSRINIGHYVKELGWEVGDQLLLEVYRGCLLVENLSKGLLPAKERLMKK